MGIVAVNYLKKVFIWELGNKWKYTLKQFSVYIGHSVEFLSRDILLRGVSKNLKFIDYRVTGCSRPSTILGMHSSYIFDIQRIAKNIVIIASDDGSIKVIDPIRRKCYQKFK